MPAAVFGRRRQVFWQGLGARLKGAFNGGFKGSYRPCLRDAGRSEEVALCPGLGKRFRKLAADRRGGNRKASAALAPPASGGAGPILVFSREISPRTGRLGKFPRARPVTVV